MRDDLKRQMESELLKIELEAKGEKPLVTPAPLRVTTMYEPRSNNASGPLLTHSDDRDNNKILDDARDRATSPPATLSARTSLFAWQSGFTQLTNTLSKKLDNHEVACAMNFAY
jgi:hypothetical protein